MSVSIVLSRGKTTIIDEADHGIVSQYKWWLRSGGQRSKDYAYTQVRRRTIYLHRLLVRPERGVFVDHINGNGLDNRRSNLRLCTPTQNSANRVLPLHRHGYRGIELMPSGKWRAVAQKNGVNRRSSPFLTKEDAARAYDQLAVEAFGEFAILNFPKDQN